MSHGPEFFQTMMGRKFYEADVPRLLAVLERIAAALEESTARVRADVLEEVGMVAAFNTREACAEEAQKLWGEEAAAEIRKVGLPHEQAEVQS